MSTTANKFLGVPLSHLDGIMFVLSAQCLLTDSLLANGHSLITSPLQRPLMVPFKLRQF
jgi:hypothetical protein